MGEKRKPVKTLLLKNQGKTGVKIELFCASNWGKQKGLFRARINGAWHSPKEKYTYFSSEGVQALMGRLLFEDEPYACPEIKKGDRLSIPSPDSETGLNQFARAGTDPIQAVDGRWYAWATMYQGSRFVALDEVKVL